MLSLRPYTYDDPEYDNCGSDTNAVLEIDAIRIPLCSKCLETLTRELQEFNNTIFCHKCAKFDLSSSGWHYGGTCKRTGKDAECMETCKEAEVKE